jgi:hypothetical protein
MPDAHVTELIRQRRRLVPNVTEPDVPGTADAPEPDDRLAVLRSSLEAARAASRQHARDLDVLQAETAALRERTVELRSRRQGHVADLRAAADQRRGA